MKIDIKKELQNKIQLRFRENGKFRILMVSDIHGGRDYEWERTSKAMKVLVDSQQPDLVLLGGDIAGPGRRHVENEEDLRHILDTLTAPMTEKNIPWAHVFGNHDDNFGYENEDQQKVYETYPLCLSKAGPEDIDGTGNYVLPIYDAKGEKILFNIFGLDSHQGVDEYKTQYGLPQETKMFHTVPGANGGYDGVRFNQIMWYWQLSEELEKFNGAKIPALMYMHMPIPEHALVALFRDDTKFKGYCLENIAGTIINHGLFGACLERGDVKGIFCGHEHENDFVGEYCGIKIGYDGFLSYHAGGIDELRGGRVFDIDAADPANFTTYSAKLRDIVGHECDR